MGEDGKTFVEHNKERLADIECLWEYYVKTKQIDKYVRNLFFWGYAYAMLVFHGREIDARKEIRKLFQIGGLLSEKDRDLMMESIEKRYREHAPYLLGNQKFLELFPVAKPMGLITSKVANKNVRKKLYEIEKRIERIKKGTDYHTKVEKRREKVMKMRLLGKSEKQIAKTLKVSLSTVEKDVHAMKEEMCGVLSSIAYQTGKKKRVFAIVHAIFKKLRKQRKERLCRLKQNTLSQLYQCSPASSSPLALST